MQLVERHTIDRHDPRFAVIDPACFASKNVHKTSNYASLHEMCPATPSARGVKC